jgi:hypothetical protein
MFYKCCVLTESCEKSQTFFPPPTLLIVTVFLVLKNGVKCSKNHRTKKLLDHFFDFFLCWQLFSKKLLFAPLCWQLYFFKKLWQNFFQKKKIGHFKNVQKKNFENTFVTKFCKTAKIPSFYYQILWNVIFFLQDCLF